MKHLIIFAGHAGSGKTTLSQKIASLYNNVAWLDKDILCETFTAWSMKQLTGNPLDRDSKEFSEFIRPLEYKHLNSNINAQLNMGFNVVVCAPFGREFKDLESYNNFINNFHNVKISVVWCFINDTEAKQRIIDRNHPMDDWKLKNWDQYISRRYIPKWAEAHKDILLLDNTLYTDSYIYWINDRIME